MCEDCFRSGPVNLIREFPKNKVDRYTTPSEYLLGWAEARGLFEVTDRTYVRSELPNGGYGEVEGYYVEYRGAFKREYSSPMFTFKSANDDCYHCRTWARLETGEDHLGGREYADYGCPCGDISRPGYDCPDHPLPSIDSRWVRKNQGRDSSCHQCNRPLDQEYWHERNAWYCDDNCRRLYDLTHDRRQVSWTRGWRGRSKRG